MAALEQERQAAVDEQRRAAEVHIAELEAERLRQEDLAKQLSRTEVRHASAHLNCPPQLPCSCVI